MILIDRPNIHQRLYSFLITIIVLMSALGCQLTEKKVKPPNIVLIMSDDQGWGDLGINGNKQLNSPNLDHLAQNGVQFGRFYVSPVCSPTRAELLTGRYHPRGGIYDTSRGGERLDLDEKTLADIFGSNGYKTAAFGKWHSGSQGPFHPNNRGFDEFYGFCSGHWGNYFNPMLERNGEIVKGNRFIIDDLTEQAMNYIDDNKESPFLVYLSYNTPHSPMQVPDEWWNKYKDTPIDSTHRYAHKEQADKTRAALALCENIDWNVGRVLHQLKELELLENTIVVYLSDNGPNGWRWNDGMKGIKGHTDEGGVRSPLIISWKTKLKSLHVSQVTSAIDLLPTLIELTGIEEPFNVTMDGKSLSPLLKGDASEWPHRYVYSHWNGRVSVRDQQYLLDHQNNLFDLRVDPGQESPLVNPPDSLYNTFLEVKKAWKTNVLSELNINRKERFPVGYDKSKYTQLPARDGNAHGQIKRSNKYPNSSFFTDWKTVNDSLTWDCNILNEGNYKATVYYTCKENAIGAELIIKQGKNSVSKILPQAHDPPFTGVEFDRVPRAESYEKNFLPLEVGELKLDKGEHRITIKATKLQDSSFIDLRLLVLERIRS